MWNKQSEFTAWLLEVKDVNLESLPPWEEKKRFQNVMEDHNTGFQIMEKDGGAELKIKPNSKPKNLSGSFGRKQPKTSKITSQSDGVIQAIPIRFLEDEGQAEKNEGQADPVPYTPHRIITRSRAAQGAQEDGSGSQGSQAQAGQPSGTKTRTRTSLATPSHGDWREELVQQDVSDQDILAHSLKDKALCVLTIHG